MGNKRYTSNKWLDKYLLCLSMSKTKIQLMKDKFDPFLCSLKNRLSLPFFDTVGLNRDGCSYDLFVITHQIDPTICPLVHIKSMREISAFERPL